MDTIVAPGTPAGYGAVHMVRISGGRALGILRAITDRDNFRPRVATLVRIFDDEGKVLDEAIAIYYKAPHSYTGEDVVELFVHGNPIIQRAVTELVIRHGARLAEPGEFTRRALMAGKMTLDQVEALHTVIYARSLPAVKAAGRVLRGGLRDLWGIYEDLLGLAASMRVYVDFPEDVEMEDYGFDDVRSEFMSRLGSVLGKLEDILSRAVQGRRLAEGFAVVLAGAPNVGKSSLLNALLGYDRAIVSDIPGTTRDYIEQIHEIAGIPVRLLDVAGIRETRDPVEAEGVKRAIGMCQNADVVLWVLDGSRGITAEDMFVYSQISDDISLVVINKVDLLDDGGKGLAEEVRQRFGLPVVAVSALKGDVRPLVDALREMLEPVEEPIWVSMRVEDHLRRAVSRLTEAIDLIKADMPEVASVLVERGAKEIGAVLGRGEVGEDILDKLFSTFCIGK